MPPEPVAPPPSALPAEIQKELDELRAFRKKTDPLIEQARKQDAALKRVRDNDPELFDYIVRTARGEAAERPTLRTPATAAPETASPVEDESDPTEKRFRYLEEEILNMGRTLAKAVDSKLGPIVAGQARTQWDVAIERLRQRVEKKDGPGTFSDEIVARMEKLAEELPGVADHAQGIEHLYALATRAEAEQRGYDRANREAEERGSALDAIWSPVPRGPGAGTPDLEGLTSMEDIVAAAARDPEMWDRETPEPKAAVNRTAERIPA